jgi:hypothetical protein
MPKEIAKLQVAALLEQMPYYVSTALGISDDSYSHSEEESPIYSMGQGSWLQI